MGGAAACYVPTLLLTDATTHGHTATIADRLADALRALGIGVDLRDVQQLGDADPGSYDAVVAGPRCTRVITNAPWSTGSRPTATTSPRFPRCSSRSR